MRDLRRISQHGRTARYSSSLAWLLVLGCATSFGAVPLRPDLNNPHYFMFRGEPTVLVGSSEHYGALINRDFDYVVYLKTLEESHLNVTRLFTGIYRELPGKFAPGFDFEIVDNTLAPRPERVLSPWARSQQPGAGDGQHKYDLGQWDVSYFRRLKDFVQEAGKRGIVVEVSLFSPYYGENVWALSPLNSANNIGGVGVRSRSEFFATNDPQTIAAQDAMVRKIVETLKDFDNVYYEICNEPYQGDDSDQSGVGKVPLQWQKHIARTIEAAEADLPVRHMIAQEIAFGSQRATEMVPQASLYLFHGTRSAKSVHVNYDLGKALGSNENGFDGVTDAPYRVQAWQYLIAGGALTMGLDYSFTVEQPDGRFQLPIKQPGGGSPRLRMELGILRDFMKQMNVEQMKPQSALVRTALPPHTSVLALADDGHTYAIYIHHGYPLNPKRLSDPGYAVDDRFRTIRLVLTLHRGSYNVEWIDTKSGAVARREQIHSRDGTIRLKSPTYSEDIAIRITQQRI
jgi:hypothetical protein